MAFAPATRVQAPGLVVGVAAATAAALGVLVDVDVLGAGQLVQGLAVAVPAARRAFLLDCRSLRLVGNGEAGQGVGVVDEHLVQLTDEALDVAAIVLIDRATDLLHLGVDLHRAAADLQPVGLVGVQRLDEVGNRLAAVLARLDVEERLAGRAGYLDGYRLTRRGAAVDQLQQAAVGRYQRHRLVCLELDVRALEEARAVILAGIPQPRRADALGVQADRQAGLASVFDANAQALARRRHAADGGEALGRRQGEGQGFLRARYRHRLLALAGVAAQFLLRRAGLAHVADDGVGDEGFLEARRVGGLVHRVADVLPHRVGPQQPEPQRGGAGQGEEVLRLLVVGVEGAFQYIDALAEVTQSRHVVAGGATDVGGAFRPVVVRAPATVDDLLHQRRVLAIGAAQLDRTRPGAAGWHPVLVPVVTAVGAFLQAQAGEDLLAGAALVPAIGVHEEDRQPGL
ncbi:Uncharacterised protein [Klebsiella pneumoniae]|nr:Uncharacterised protein [Pseudomonas aeruginosa]SVJ66901.1 Uncharacterised protein [Klebsiella pneumoniae]